MSKGKIFFTVTAILLFSLAACQRNDTPAIEPAEQSTPEVESTHMTSETPIPSPEPSTTQPPPRSLVICLGQEPLSLYLYGSASRSTWSVLEAVYDGPFDLHSYEPQPVILEEMPSFANGDAYYQPVSVAKGDQVVDIHGDLISLQAGVQVQPSGCSSSDCVITWDGESELQMDQTVVIFRLIPDIRWSDGAPLTAADSIYSFRIAADPNTPVSRQVLYRTADYTALGPYRVQWVGLPGFFPERYDSLFWTPLPEHALGQYSPAELNTHELANRYPLGWGAYIIEEWIAGDHIQLRRNPTYFRAAEGLPAFDTLVYRFLDEPGDSILDALLSKECDVIDQSSALEEQLTEIADQQNLSALAMHVGLGPEWEQLAFGIQHASYDDGYSALSGDRPDFFSDVRTRQAIAHCIDREGIIADLLGGLSEVPFTYLPPDHPYFNPELPIYAYDVNLAHQLLDQVGWKDWDGNPDTPLQAVGIETIYDGTYFSLQYYTTEAPLRQQIAERLKDSLKTCGIELQINLLAPDALYAPGPEGILFGRKFDLVQFSWRTGLIPPCSFYTSDQIPDLENNWLTLNVSGYANAAFDRACLESLIFRPDQSPAYRSAQERVQQLFSEEMPVVPLYFRIKLALSRPDFCGIKMDTTARSTFWNLEELNYGDECP